MRNMTVDSGLDTGLHIHTDDDAVGDATHRDVALTSAGPKQRHDHARPSARRLAIEHWLPAYGGAVACLGLATANLPDLCGASAALLGPISWPGTLYLVLMAGVFVVLAHLPDRHDRA